MNTQSIKTISIADDFSRYPAGRYQRDGDASGEAFREKCLVPALQDRTIGKVIVDFDRVAGFGSSFLEEAFGGLVRVHNMSKTNLDQRLKLITREPELEDFIALARRYIKQAT